MDDADFILITGKAGNRAKRSGRIRSVQLKRVVLWAVVLSFVSVLLLSILDNRPQQVADLTSIQTLV